MTSQWPGGLRLPGPARLNETQGCIRHPPAQKNDQLDKPNAVPLTCSSRREPVFTPSTQMTYERRKSFRRSPLAAAMVLAPKLGAFVRAYPDVVLDGVGLTFLMEEHAAPYLASGALVRVLDWCEPFAGYFLYYSSRRQQPAALSALIDTLR